MHNCVVLNVARADLMQLHKLKVNFVFLFIYNAVKCLQEYTNTHTHICKLRVCMWRWETKPVPVSSRSLFSISIPVFWCNPTLLLIHRDTCRSLVIFWPGRHRETLLLSKAKMKVYVQPLPTSLWCDVGMPGFRKLGSNSPAETKNRWGIRKVGLSLFEA